MGPGPAVAEASGADRGTFNVRSERLSPMQALAVARERRLWDHRAGGWDDGGATGLGEVVKAVLGECQKVPDAVAVDLGAGSGAVTLPLAGSCRRVLAVDVSGALLARLAEKAATDGLDNIELLTHPIETLEFAPESLDLIVSNYALHHLRDADKARLLERSHVWLRRGGRLVIGDMMFGRAVTAENRQIVRSKASVFLRRGPSGWFRLIKNLVRFALRAGEKPIPPAAWETLARRAGFQTVTITQIVSEAHVLVAQKAS